MIGAPIRLTKDDDREEARLRVERELTAVTDAADRHLGLEPIPPAPPKPVEPA